MSEHILHLANQWLLSVIRLINMEIGKKPLDSICQFVLDLHNKIVSEEIKDLVRRLLLEKLSIGEIYQTSQVTQLWLLKCIKEECQKYQEILASKRHLYP